MIIRKYKTVIVVLGLLLALIGGRALIHHRQYVGGLERTHQDQLRDWTSTRQGIAYRLDMDLADALIAPSHNTLTEALTNAYRTAWEGRELMWGNSLIRNVNVAIERGRFRSAYEEMASYLYYLSHEVEFPLKTVEVENLELIRSYAEVLFTGFSGVLDRIIRAETSQGWYATLQYSSWRQIENDQHLVAEIDDMGYDLRLMPPIGEGDHGYRAYLDAKHTGRPNLEHGLADSNEPVLPQEALIDIAHDFLAAIGAGELQAPSSKPPQTVTNSSSPASGYSILDGGEDRFIGDFIHFEAQDKETQAIYRLSLTHIGGHIKRFSFQQFDSEVNSVEKAIELGKSIVAEWARHEGVTLELTQTHQREGSNTASFGYSIVTDNVLVRSPVVELRVDINNSLKVEIEAIKYLVMYNHPQETSPLLTVEDALATLSPQLTLAGTPRLEITHGTLVYNIPVTGVKWVDAVYVDALTGELIGKEYDYSRP